MSGIAAYTRPQTVDAALASLATGNSQILAGGTDFYPALGERVVQQPVVDISALTELRGITRKGSHFRIGALTTWTDVIHAALPPCFDALKSAAREVGSVQIQNRGTVAGNLCNASPAADGVPPLLILDAEIELLSHTSHRQIPLHDFLVGNRKTKRRPDELLTAILIPNAPVNARSAFLKLGARRYLVISISMVAAALVFGEDDRVSVARVAVGSCSAVARRLPQLERDLIGIRRIDPGHPVNAEHLSDLSPIDDVRATAAYRVDATTHLIQRALAQCGGRP
ncbi:MAG TPA: xanthine dehydrogenase family protein subunit M [Terriglobales bacterium]|nr:xanthine dehydrogenase family protein subunit M [Terriglobales bacterium]